MSLIIAKNELIGKQQPCPMRNESESRAIWLKIIPAHSMKTIMKLEELSQFLDGTQPVIFKINSGKKAKYDWLRHELVRFDYR